MTSTIPLPEPKSKFSSLPGKEKYQKIGLFIFVLINIIAVVILAVDHFKYPGNTAPSASMKTLRDGAFVILGLSAIMILFAMAYMIHKDTATGKKMAWFLLAVAVFYVAAGIYAAYYKYHLKQNGSTSSGEDNAYVASLAYVVIVTVAVICIGGSSGGISPCLFLAFM